MRGFLKFLAWAGGILLVIGLVLNFTVFDSWVVPNDDPVFAVSILPTMRPGNRILLLRSASIAPGNLARCADPDAPGRYVVARVVGRGGDAIEAGEQVLVNGKRNPSPHACAESKVFVRHPVTQEDVRLDCVAEDTSGNEHEALRDLQHPEATAKTVVEAGKIYLISDNRHLHLDSRDFGQIDPATCQHIVFRLWGESWFDASQRFTFLW
jgi:signal peptidase I